MGLKSFSVSSDEMLGLWKLTMLYEPVRKDCAVTRTDGIDLDTLLRQQIDAWYARMLLDSPVQELPLTEIAPLLTPVRRANGSAEVSLPEGTVRVASAMMEGWIRPAAVTDDPLSALAREQSSPFGRGGIHRPVAVVHPDGRMTLHTPAPGTLRLISVMAVVRPADGSFLLTEAMLSHLPEPR